MSTKGLRKCKKCKKFIDNKKFNRHQGQCGTKRTVKNGYICEEAALVQQIEDLQEDLRIVEQDNLDLKEELHTTRLRVNKLKQIFCAVAQVLDLRHM